MSEQAKKQSIPRSADGTSTADEKVDEASLESFPASDPPATSPSHAGPPSPGKGNSKGK